jgi:solute carrier family 25 protein 34/35
VAVLPCHQTSLRAGWRETPDVEDQQHMARDGGEPSRPWWTEFVTAGTSAVLAICITNPIDVVKTRMTLQGQAGSVVHNDPLSALVQIGRAEGIGALQRGLPASCLWQFSNVSVRFGVYAVAKRRASVEKLSPFQRWVQSLGLAAVSGGLAALASNPFFILKTRCQVPPAAASSSSSAAAAAPVPSVAAEALSIYRSDGLLGFFRGLTAFAPRVIVASAVQLSTYDAVKEELVRRTGLRPDGAPLVLCASFVTGAAVVLAMQPFDYAATRLVATQTAAEAKGRTAAAVEPNYSGPLDVIRRTLRTDGVTGLYRCARPTQHVASPN